ncbi:hypothetical protein CDD80_4866 [Ophiocordyceps camponoti-rufipedis]|uniref:Uncharacterized protein n=1 Tax=Ophiocordyceps camponoti-rufipedis TaxID=2004952 RepID=A0A2C5ZHR9_9HYPO|nr:hypothetical protein CDD80_4866 [Ophiocordyceps camponoti-rufipedis]
MAQSPNRSPHIIRLSQAFHLPRCANSLDHILAATATMSEKSSSGHLHSLITSAAPTFAGADLHQLPSAKPQTRFFATTPDAETLLLSLAPCATTLLRCERSLIPSEVALLRWLSGVSDDTSGRDGVRRVVPQPSPQLLRPFLPSLLKHGRACNGRHGEYILTKPVAGTTIASLNPPLTNKERMCVDFQVGQLLRCISSHQSPNGKFGTAVAVLSEPTASDALWQRAVISDLNSCHDKWSDAFLCILESALRDAEDFRVAIRTPKNPWMTPQTSESAVFFMNATMP